MLNAKKINSLDLSRLNFSVDKKRYLFLAKKDKIDFIYNTAALEGVLSHKSPFPTLSAIIILNFNKR
ncbi:hypothetical protein [Bathymodiolus platifrons methanotrophic gill symbiont]|uniref:hypothetical protein n=1 Tax=Bathymodiolus platifrons methanotrophic gill symbiont TaxID=113268 RepID=UPI001C8DD9DA|nr:hypothetical protein [Bathymodiolus platifrons methanotrophic gill symbiont]